MEKMKSLADQLREKMTKPVSEASKGDDGKKVKSLKKIKTDDPEPALLALIREYDNSANKSMVHVRFDEKTVNLMNRFKMATQVDISKLVAFSVRHLFENHPELKTIIKQFIQNTEL